MLGVLWGGWMGVGWDLPWLGIPCAVVRCLILPRLTPGRSVRKQLLRDFVGIAGVGACFVRYFRPLSGESDGGED